MAALKPVYLLAGSDRPKIDVARARLRARFQPEAVEQLSAQQSSGEDAVAACNALGLFGDGERLILVEDVDRWKAADVKAIAGYLESPAPLTVLALVGEESKRDGALAKVCAKVGELLVFDVPRRKLAEWGATQFRAAGADADPAACRALVEAVGENVYALATEVDKLVTWAGGAPIGEQEVEQLAATWGDAPPWALTDAWGRRDVGAVLAAAEATLEREAGPRSGALARLAGLLSNHVSLVRACQDLASEGVSPQVAAGRLKKRPYPVQKAFGQASSFGADELREAVVRIARLDLALKGGSRLPADLELERALVDVTRPAAVGGGR